MKHQTSVSRLRRANVGTFVWSPEKTPQGEFLVKKLEGLNVETLRTTS